MSKFPRIYLLIVLLLSAGFALSSCMTTRRGGNGGGDSDSSDDDDDTGGGGGDLTPTGEGPCEDGGDCEGGICVALIDEPHPPVYCTEPCDGGCPSDMYCDSDTFSLAELDFCRLDEDGDGEAPTEQNPPEEPPSLPCSTDADCEDALICAEYMGERGCAPTCSTDDDCVVSLSGVTFALAACGQEDGGRQVCLPREECYDGSLTAFMDCMQMDMPF